MKTCVIDDCAAKVKARGWCGKHYHRWERTGDPMGILRRGLNVGCSVEGCDGVHHSRGWCVKHYTRWQRHADPLTVLYSGEHLASSGYMVTRVPIDHPLAGSEGRVYVHRLRLYERIGYGPHWCHWCDRSISWRAQPLGIAVVGDHVDFDKLNNDPANLVESCTACNITRTPDCFGTGERQ